MERKLVTIVCADVAGYSRLIGLDEEGTIARLKAHRRTLINPAIARHGGRLVKTMGDGLLVEFASPVEAVRCAAEIQLAMAAREAASRRIAASSSGSASILATWSSRTVTCWVTASTSPPGWKPWPMSAASASPARCATKSATGFR